jgi:predicted nucleic acid-binding protein
MIVVDASVVVDFLLGIEPAAGRLLERLGGSTGALAAPHLLDAEVAQVLRRFVLQEKLTVARAMAALEDLADLPLVRFAHTPFLVRAFELRGNATVYDAIYLVLAETLGARLLTRDAALGGVPGHTADVDVVG